MNRNRITTVVLLLLIVATVIFAVWYSKNHKDNTVTNPNLSLTAYNQTQSLDATTSTAHPKDVIVYTVKVANPSDTVITGYVIEVSIGGVTNSSALIDASGANYNSANNSLVWTPLDVPANDSIQKQFTIRIKDSLPANASDKVIKVSFGNEVVVNTDYAQAAVNLRPGSVGSTGASYKAPKTGIPGWISFYLACFLTFGIMLFRIASKMGKPTN